MGELKAQLGELDTRFSSSSFLKDIMKMADIDIDPFSDHDKMDAQPDEMGKTISLTTGGVRGATWEPEQETSFGGMSIKDKGLREHFEELYQKLSEITPQTAEVLHFNDFEFRDGKLYYRNKSMPLTKEGKN